MARIRFPALLGSAALALLLSAHAQEQAATSAPANQTTVPANQTTAQAPAAPQPTPPTTPTNQTTGNQTTTGGGAAGGGGRPSAMSQLEVLLKGNHSWFDPSNLIHYESNDYQIVNHSPDAICNVTLSAPVATPPERTTINSSYNARVANSTRQQGIDIFAPMGGENQIPPNGVLDLGFILAHQMSSAQENTTTIATAAPTVQSAQYCDELPSGGATQGMAGGATGNQTTGMAGGAPPAGNATTTTPAPAGNQTTATSGANTTTTVTPPEGGQPVAGRKGSKGSDSKNLNLRHW